MSVHASEPDRYDAERYFALVECGIVSPDERNELLDGVIVAMAPQSPLHAAGVYRVDCALRAAFPPGTVIRGQSPMVAGGASVPEPDLAVLFGSEADYVIHYPGTALLVVEIAVSTVTQDRLTKSRIYAGAGVKNYWIVQPGEEWVEVYTDVRPELRVYGQTARFEHGSILEVEDAPGVQILADDLFPSRRT
jgi:Uma2 family endonuclease